MRTNLLLILAAMLVAASCSPRIVERIVQKTDTTYIERMRLDSIWQKDSVFIREKADTVFVYREHIRDRFRFIHDTTAIVRIDSVAYETIKEVEIEKPLSAWKKAKIEAFWWLLGALVAALLWIFRKPILSILKI